MKSEIVEELIIKLKEGNQRFIKNVPRWHDFVNERKVVEKAQHPQIIVLACSDSRVDPAYIFDANIGDLFIIRTAGNVLDKVAIGSIEFAAYHLKCPLILILGHESCGAISAALLDEPITNNINAIINEIKPAIETVKMKEIDAEVMFDEIVCENVRLQRRKLVNYSPLLNDLITKEELFVIGGVYSLHTGEVKFLDDE